MTHSPKTPRDNQIITGFDYGEKDQSCLTISEVTADKVVLVKSVLYGDDALYVQKALEQAALQPKPIGMKVEGLSEAIEAARHAMFEGEAWPMMRSGDLETLMNAATLYSQSHSGSTN